MNTSVTRVLIIDDSQVERLLLKSILQKAGVASVQEAENGQVGIAKSKVAFQMKQAFNVIFVDLQMPGIDGLGTVKALRKDSETKHSVIIMLTGASEKENVAAALEAGVDDFIVKPMKEEIVVAKLAHYIPLTDAK